ncbi:hypothetical protein OG195_02360 [Streptomyces sp. NBC_01362]|uniref:hypothetical protein n=1 Tax=Streptomyces sp. NBC_01362 TaxID=2903839 RepID=UPI002E3360A5|nr:hypothetical protein [Streptomyces sp. NBC_01362]
MRSRLAARSTRLVLAAAAIPALAATTTACDPEDAADAAGPATPSAAKAKPGITCFLEVNTPSLSFGSGADGVASPVGQGGEDPIKLTGSAVAYTGINPKTTDGDGSTEFENVIISTTEDDPNPAELKLPDPATVEKPIVTNWAANRAEAVPVIV